MGGNLDKQCPGRISEYTVRLYKDSQWLSGHNHHRQDQQPRVDCTGTFRPSEGTRQHFYGELFLQCNRW